MQSASFTLAGIPAYRDPGRRAAPADSATPRPACLRHSASARYRIAGKISRVQFRCAQPFFGRSDHAACRQLKQAVAEAVNLPVAAFLETRHARGAALDQGDIVDALGA